MEERIIKLTGEKELRIFMQPLRQKILRTMRLYGLPMTAKQLADTLGITPSAAKHHLTQLASIGVAAFHHTEMIHGITATFYWLPPVTVSIGLDDKDLLEERMLVTQNLLMNVFGGFRDRCAEAAAMAESGRFDGDILTGAVHLRQKDADELYRQIKQFINEHETPGEGTVPFEYALILYQTGTEKP